MRTPATVGSARFSAMPDQILPVPSVALAGLHFSLGLDAAVGGERFPHVVGFLESAVLTK